LKALTFTDLKRPITVELLERLNIRALAEDADLVDERTASRSRGFYAERPVSMQTEFVMERPHKNQRCNPRPLTAGCRQPDAGQPKNFQGWRGQFTPEFFCYHQTREKRNPSIGRPL